MDSSLDDWFSSEILPHERALMRFLRRVWPNSADIPDLRHDIYIRILESAATSRPALPRAFLFATARNLLIDRARRNRIVSIDLMEDLESLNFTVDEISPERQVSGRQQLLRLAAAFNELPSRCRDVMWMRKVEEASQKEIAQRMAIAEATVEAHLVRGVKLLGALFHDDSESQATQERSGGVSNRRSNAD
ncbi:sigma-70 family RNA polymerase sigma factor [Steroidobacter sp.]|uniref:sigma-70 family RNA polymerase sigma factor n=1 Tax=Steroidobacter sp. TaxID=1978227 RepID=UPI001A42DF0A|nr:sigma-70 family RNA polymerase sigma factor [Steroidobacter sp.]MBL8269086.1 sigma-70 family RNA polymerase sigma factor [Steroidobacter sp.]